MNSSCDRKIMNKRCGAASTPLPKYQIQLLADKSVVLVEASGYESEIFLPQLQYGRIGLVNVICSRQPRLRMSQLSLVQVTALRQRKQRLGHYQHRKLTTATAGLAPAKQLKLNKADLVMAANAQYGRLRFELKLISKGNVVLAECNGYESEIFLPHISSHCIAMKRVTAGELAQCAQNTTRSPQKSLQLALPQPVAQRKVSASSTAATAAVAAASVAAQAMGLTQLLVNPMQMFSKTQTAPMPQPLAKGVKPTRRHIKQLNAENMGAGDQRKHKLIASRH